MTALARLLRSPDSKKYIQIHRDLEATAAKNFEEANSSRLRDLYEARLITERRTIEKLESELAKVEK